ncbi:MAG: tRNA (adenosine(37)-N6)-threonylcarbamoyltransferase complex dimerization subunit type 1 TsaB [Ignavibacteria bacterium]|nr:tRNA (adenosine(37)-N6)-threonylcarbamoyltransferase complex dimerization subunit type 1 TsaB [Ignavibacteria bacterium]
MAMSLLAIETSGSVCSAAVSIDGNLVSSVEILRQNVHDELLAEITSEAMKYAEIPLSSIDIVAVSSGPGSFTGLRIGASFAKGLCFFGQTRLLPVPSHVAIMAAALEVAAYSGVEHIVCAIPSHRDLVYVSTTRASELDVAATAELLTITQAQERFVSDREMIVGPGAPLLTNSPISGLSRTSARFVAYAAWIMLGSGVSTVDADSFVPDYHQEFQPR